MKILQAHLYLTDFKAHLYLIDFKFPANWDNRI